MNERVYAQVSHGERHDDWCHEGSRTNQPLEGGPPALVQSIESIGVILIVFAHHLNFHFGAMTLFEKRLFLAPSSAHFVPDLAIGVQRLSNEAQRIVMIAE